MPNLIPTNHWSFRSLWKAVDIHRILSEAKEANATLIRVRLPARKGLLTYLFILKNTGDYTALEHMTNRLNPAIGMYPMEEGLQHVSTADAVNCAWFYIRVKNVEDEKRILQLVSDARSFRKKLHRVTVECL